jgi:hypothetical protein
MNLDIGVHAVGVEEAESRVGCNPCDRDFSIGESDSALWGQTRKASVGGDPLLRETTQRTPSSAERRRDSDRPVAGAACAIGATEPAVPGAQSDPAKRLLELTAELGRLAGEIVEAAPVADGQGPDAKLVRGIIRARRRRAEVFGADLFADPVWDMMLDLLAAQLEGRPVSTSSLCIAAGVPGTTALRWIRQATARGLFVRIADPRDGRGVLVALSKDTADRMLKQLAAGGAAFAL